MSNLVSDARALSPGQYGHLVVYGSTVVGDGGGGFYIWSAAATNIDDGADWLKPNSITHPDPGRWQRVWSATQAATTLVPGIVMLGADGETTAGEAVQCSDTRLHPATTLAGTPSYITIDGGTQVITRALVNLASHVTGILPVVNGGTGLGSAHNHDADYISVVSTPTVGNFPVLTAGGELNNSTYSNASFATSAQGALADTAIQPAGIGTIATQAANSVAITGGSITGITDLAIADGGTGAGDAATAFANLKQAATTTATGVVELATDGETASGVVVQGNDSRLHVAVTLAGTPAYLTIDAGTQVITRVLIDLTSHVTGLLPQANIGNLTTATETGTSRTNTATDRNQFVRWTNTGAKTLTVENSVAAAGDAWSGINVAATGNLTIAQGSGVTLTGNLIFAPLKAYTIRFTAASTADVIGGSAT